MMGFLRRILYVLCLKVKYRNRKLKICISANVSKTKFEDHISVADKVRIIGSYCGRFTYIGKESDLSNAKIGRFCSISHNVVVCRGNHPLTFVTTHPSFYYDTTKQIGFTIHRGADIYDRIIKYPEGESKYQVIIGNDVWIGAHVLILGGVTIGNGAVIGAGSVVTKDVGPYSVVAGNPAKLIKKRFADQSINRLQTIRWWDKPLKTIIDSYKDYLDCDQFLKIN
jgi:acetyltransferase-like isoleucine patch superfamily enzyme